MIAPNHSRRLPTSGLAFGLIVIWAGLMRLIPYFILTGKKEFHHTGGLFYAFAAAIRDGDFAFPETIPHYTLDGLPFAYPPLAFYVEALTGAGPNSILLLNAVFSTLAVVAFGTLVFAVPELTGNGRWLAMLTFATLPSTYLEHLAGEGLAESLGVLILILFLRQLFLLATPNPSQTGRLLAGVFLGLGVLAAPGTAYAMPVLLVLWLAVHFIQAADGHQRRQLIVTFIAACGVGLIVVSPYLVAATAHHGFQVFLEPFSNEGSNIGFSIFGLFFAFTMQNYAGVIVPSLGQLLAIWGLLYVLLRRHAFLLLATLFLICMPREGVWLSAVMLSLLAGLGWEHVLLPGFKALSQTITDRQVAEKALIAVVVYGGGLSPAFSLLLYVGFDALYQDYVQPEEYAVLQMIAADTPADAAFLVLANEIEWFPLLAERTVLNVEFGTEWVPDKRQVIVEFNKRLNEVETAQDLQALLQTMSQEEPQVLPWPDYVYIAKDETTQRANPTATAGLIRDLKRSPLFPVYFENEQVLVLAGRPD